MSVPLPVVGPAYLARFECLADKCEDTCCAGLKVPVDAHGYDTMREALSADGMPRERFEQLVPLNQDRSDPEQHAFIQMEAHQGCPFLDEHKLCGIHRRHGPGALANACATFPRSTTRLSDRLEVAGSLACPEIVRLSLLSDESLMPVPLTEAVVPRAFVNRMLADGDDPYAAHRDAVRASVFQALSDQRFPLSSRLVFLGQLGHWLASCDADEVNQRLSLLEDAAVLGPIHANFSALALMTQKWIALALSILQQVQSGAPPRLARIVEGTLRRFGGPTGPGLSDLYQERLVPLRRSFGAQLERVFRRYALSWWYRNPHTDSDDVTSHAFKLAFRLAMLHVMLAGHPDLVDGMTSEALDLVIVEVVQVFAKHLELCPALQDWTTGLAATSDSFANLVLLAKLV